MIDKVIILGIRRANQLIPDHEIGQMVGRCGRSYTSSGEAILLVQEKDLEQANKYMSGKPKPILSSMFELENVCFHCIPEIHHGEIYDEETFNKWYSRSLSYIQKEIIGWNDVKDFLIKTECTGEKEDKLVLTGLGEISYRFYYPPDRVYWLKEKIQLAVNTSILKNPIAISWILGYQHCAIGDADSDELSEFKSELKSLGLYCNCGELIEAYAYYCILSRRRPKWLKHKIEELSKDIERLFAALKQIVDDYSVETDKSLDIWLQCFKMKCPYGIGELSLEFPGASLSLLLELDDLSIHSVGELENNRHRIESYGSESIKRFFRHFKI